MHLHWVVGDVDLERNAYALLVEDKAHFASPKCNVLLNSVLHFRKRESGISRKKMTRILEKSFATVCLINVSNSFV
jgi:hypothetical protein